MISLAPSLRVVSASTELTNTLKWKLVDAYKGFKLYQDANAVPRLFLVHDMIVEPDGFNTVERIRNFDVDSRHTVLLEAGTTERSDLPSTVEASAGGSEGAEHVMATQYQPEDIVIDVQANAPGWVVLTDAWYSGWQATVDGRSVPIEIADHAFRAVRVDAGSHTLVMQFKPDSWVWGSLISFLSLLAVVVGLVILVVLPRRAVRRRT